MSQDVFRAQYEIQISGTDLKQHYRECKYLEMNVEMDLVHGRGGIRDLK